MPGWRCTLVVGSLLLALSSSTSAQSTTRLVVRSAAPEKGWAIAEVRSAQGYPITLGPLGKEIDAVERQQFDLFDGFSDQTSALYPFQIPVSGFILAEVFESRSGRPFVAVTYRNAGVVRRRIVRIKTGSLDALLKHVGVSGEAIEIAADLTSVPITRDLYTISRRQRAKISTPDSTYTGHLLPVIEQGSIYIDLRDGRTQKIRDDDIERLTIERSIAGQILGSTAGRGVQGALTGATVGLFAGLTVGGQGALEEMRFGAVTGGIVGLGIGILDGIFSAQGSKTYTFHPKVEHDAMELYLALTF